MSACVNVSSLLLSRIIPAYNCSTLPTTGCHTLSTLPTTSIPTPTCEPYTGTLCKNYLDSNAEVYIPALTNQTILEKTVASYAGAFGFGTEVCIDRVMDGLMA